MAAHLTRCDFHRAGTPLDPDRIADAYWAIRNEDPDAWREEYRFDGALATTRRAVTGTTHRAAAGSG